MPKSVSFTPMRSPRFESTGVRRLVARARRRRRRALVADAGKRRGRRGERLAAAMLEEDVLGLHVAMDDAGAVRVRERAEQLDGERRRDLGRERARLLQELAQRLAADELDDEVLLVLVGRRDVEHLDDVAMPELRDRLGLGLEAVGDLAALAEVRVQHLDGDVAPEPLVVRTIDGRHPAVPELLEHFVLRERRYSCRSRNRRSPPSSPRRTCEAAAHLPARPSPLQTKPFHA